MTENFDWNSVTYSQITQVLQPLYKMLASKKLPVIQICQIISDTLKSFYPINTVRYHRTRIQRNKIYIGGYYYSHLDKLGKKSITIVFQHHIVDIEITLSKTKLSRIIDLIADTMLHEIIHMRQYRKRKFKYISIANKQDYKKLVTVKQRYYAHPDEIDAHAFNAACELLRSYKSIEVVKEILRTKTYPSKSIIYNQYIAAFDNNFKDPILTKFRKTIRKYLSYAEIGKPYKRAPELKWY